MVPAPAPAPAWATWATSRAVEGQRDIQHRAAGGGGGGSRARTRGMDTGGGSREVAPGSSGSLASAQFIERLVERNQRAHGCIHAKERGGGVARQRSRGKTRGPEGERERGGEEGEGGGREEEGKGERGVNCCVLCARRAPASRCRIYSRACRVRLSSISSRLPEARLSLSCLRKVTLYL